MAKVKQPLLSFDARRKLGDDIVFKRRGRTAIVETRPIPKDARSVGQLSWRHMFQKVIALWHALSAAEKEAWESLGRKRHMTGYAWFISQALRPNPGIYLPLQGGIMTGDINMGGGLITNLAAPTGATYATRRSYVIARIAADILTHKGDASAHHARYSDAEALAAGEAGGLSKVIWKDASQRVLSDAGRVAGSAYADLDLTATTSANAKFVILWIVMLANPAGTASFSSYIFRKNGTTPSYIYFVRINHDEVDGKVFGLAVVLGLDSGQVIEWSALSVATNATINCWVDVMGYIE